MDAIQTVAVTYESIGNVNKLDSDIKIYHQLFKIWWRWVLVAAHDIRCVNSGSFSRHTDFQVAMHGLRCSVAWGS